MRHHSRLSMHPDRPVVAVVGSVRREIVGPKEDQARRACRELGKTLCKGGWRIAVFSDERVAIEADVVAGYLSAGAVQAESIVCCAPGHGEIAFPEMESNGDAFLSNDGKSDNWMLSFYRSLANVDGALLLGGGPFTLLAAYRTLERGCALFSVAYFGGAAEKIYKYLAARPGRIDGINKKDVSRMGAEWTRQSALECVRSLTEQHKRFQQQRQKMMEQRRERDESQREIRRAWLYLMAAIMFLAAGWITRSPGWLYLLFIVAGVCAAGGAGATVRMLTPDAPRARRGTPPVLGVMVGLTSALFYLISQSSGESAAVLPSPRMFLWSMFVAIVAGFGFDYTLVQLMSRAKSKRGG